MLMRLSRLCGAAFLLNLAVSGCNYPSSSYGGGASTHQSEGPAPATSSSGSTATNGASGANGAAAGQPATSTTSTTPAVSVPQWGSTTANAPVATSGQAPATSNSTGSATVNTVAAAPDCYKGTQQICAIESRIGVLTNQFREQQGLGDLEFSSKVSFVARAWSTQEAQGGFISHDGWPTQREQLYQQEFGTQFTTDAENTAMNGFGNADVAQSLVQQWINSPGHRANMLGNHKILGAGVAQGSDGAWYATQIFGFQ